MNSVDAGSREVYGGHHGIFRKVHRAGWDVVCENGVPIIFPSEHEAEIAAWRALRSHLCSDIVGSGERASIAKAKLGLIFPRPGQKPVRVERR